MVGNRRRESCESYIVIHTYMLRARARRRARRCASNLSYRGCSVRARASLSVGRSVGRCRRARRCVSGLARFFVQAALMHEHPPQNDLLELRFAHLPLVLVRRDRVRGGIVVSPESRVVSSFALRARRRSRVPAAGAPPPRLSPPPLDRSNAATRARPTHSTASP